MNNRRKSYISLFFILALIFAPSGLNAQMDIPFDNPNIFISMDFQNASLKDILKIFSVQSGLNFIASENVQDRKVTLYMDKVGVKDAMDKIFTANNLVYELDRESNIFIVKDLGKPKTETETKVFPLKYATVSGSAFNREKSSVSTTAGAAAGGSSGIAAAVAKIVTENGSVMEDIRTNSIIVTDVPKNMPNIIQLVNALDVSVPQVLLEVEMLDVNKNLSEALGVKYGQSPMTLNALFKGGTFLSKFPSGSPFGTGQKTGFGSFEVNSGNDGSDISTYQVVLDFLKSQTDTKFLARPKILTLDNETAEIKISTQESVGIINSTTNTGNSSTSTTTKEAERYETGVILRVTPQVNFKTGEITMFVNPKVSEAIAGNSITEGNTVYTYRDPEERSTKSVVRIQDGETVVLGGLIRKEKTETITKLPFLGDIPVLGALFRHKNISKDKERELLVFITPHIVKDASTQLANAQVKQTGSALGAPGNKREAIITASLNAFEKKKR
ncbi:MAG: hypothetical protein MUF05_01485 [Candidatus Omnitrophica bacterium]|jgi:type II secretory pathway component GspD/PulD (secretin)|nr:hypothetical protein [Candidatus Omnitrophota bacterium]